MGIILGDLDFWDFVKVGKTLTYLRLEQLIYIVLSRILHPKTKYCQKGENNKMDTLQSLGLIILIISSNGYTTQPDSTIYPIGIITGAIVILLAGFAEMTKKERKTIEKTVYIVFPSDFKSIPEKAEQSNNIKNYIE